MRRPGTKADRFEEWVAWWLAALMLSEDDYRTIRDRATRQAEGIANYAEASIVASIWEALDEAEEGVPLEEVKANLRRMLERQWGGTSDVPGWALDLAVVQATQSAYQRGRFAELNAALRRQLSPSWTYTSALEPRTCIYCRGLHGTTLPAGHPWWWSHTPPMHSRCLCAILPAGADAALSETAPDLAAAPGFGRPMDDYEPDWDRLPAPIAMIGRVRR